MVHALKAAERPVAEEVRVTKAAWPLIANGLPGGDLAALSHTYQAVRAARGASDLKLAPRFGGAQVSRLTGPASQLAGIFRSYVLLSARGWKLLDASLVQIVSGTPAAARFARDNASLYIESIYDAHFALAQIGKKLLAGYETLGGSGDFARTLPRTEVDQLARSFSETSDRLHPHVGVRLGS